MDTNCDEFLNEILEGGEPFFAQEIRSLIPAHNITFSEDAKAFFKILKEKFLTRRILLGKACSR